jgi:uncharacterized protein YciU (UPF0263 family)
VDVSGIGFIFLSVRDQRGKPARALNENLSVYEDRGGVTLTASVDGLRTPVTIVLEIKEHLGLSTGLCNGQAAIDRDNAVAIG